MANWCSFTTADVESAAESVIVMVNLDACWSITPMLLPDGTEGLRVAGPEFNYYKVDSVARGTSGSVIVRGSFQDVALMLNAKIVDPA